MDAKSFANGFLCGLMGKGVLREAEPVAYLYNGVQLAPLPKWDKETYPYAVIMYSSFWGAMLFVSTVPLTTYGGTLRIPKGVVGKVMCYRHDGDGLHELALTGPFVRDAGWDVEGTGSGSYGTPVGINWYDLHWANFDVAGVKSGDVLLAKSDAPTPVYAMLYNGIRLPPMPEFDSETYPYVTLCKNSRPEYWLVPTKEPPIFDGENICFVDGQEQYAFTALPHAVTWYAYETGWTFENTDKYSPHIPVWSNTDIYNADGTLYLAASDPINQQRS